MKIHDGNSAVLSPSLEEQELPRRRDEVRNDAPPQADRDIRLGLASALGDMGGAVQLLLLLLNRHQVVLPDTALPMYDSLLHAIAGAAADGANWICRSRHFDRTSLLALMPEACARMQ